MLTPKPSSKPYRNGRYATSADELEEHEIRALTIPMVDKLKSTYKAVQQVNYLLRDGSPEETKRICVERMSEYALKHYPKGIRKDIRMNVLDELAEAIYERELFLLMVTENA